MRHSNWTCRAALVVGTALAAAQASPARAHDTWVLMKSYAVKPSTAAALNPISSHLFVVPGKDLLAPEKVAAVTVLAPDGTEVPAALNGDGYQTSVPLKGKGSYLALVKQLPGFYSRTPDGHAPKNKKEAPGAVECRFSEKHAKALFTVGGPGGTAYGKVLGLPAELVPLKDPATLKAGDVLEVKVLAADGKPVSTQVYGTYAGFSDDQNTFAYATSTNKEGVARVKLIKGGTWLLLAKQELPYADPATCDKQVYSGSLTFLVR